jgi:hypothetical protein
METQYSCSAYAQKQATEKFFAKLSAGLRVECPNEDGLPDQDHYVEDKAAITTRTDPDPDTS